MNIPAWQFAGLVVAVVVGMVVQFVGVPRLRRRVASARGVPASRPLDPLAIDEDPDAFLRSVLGGER